MAAEWAPRYVGEHDSKLPGISPVYGDMAGLPPIVMQSAGDDPLWIDAEKIEKFCAAATASSTIGGSRTCGMCFHLQAGVLADADEAIADLGAKLRTHTHRRKGCNKVSSFEGKVAVITGAGSGIGRALALESRTEGSQAGAVGYRR